MHPRRRVYGNSKLAAETAIQHLAPAPDLPHRVVYAARGHNFLRTMLRLARTDALRVVADQRAHRRGTLDRGGDAAVLARPEVQWPVLPNSSHFHLTRRETTWHDSPKPVDTPCARIG